MPLNPYITSELQTQGSANEQQLLAELVEESIKVWGQEFFYIPRTLVGLDDILGEDRFSKFKEAYPIEMYVESNTGFMGQGEVIQKFGLYIEQSIQVMLSRKRWREVVARYGKTILPTRPAEGDLVYYPIADKLFEIKWVEKETGFYQIGSLPTWKMTIELFQYASERMSTNVPMIDNIENLKSFDTTINTVETPDGFGDNLVFQKEWNEQWNPEEPFGDEEN